MSLRSTPAGYGRVAVTLHWISAALIVPLVPIGLTMVGMESGPTKAALYQTHVWIGLSVGLLTLVRAVWRFREPTPTVPAGISGAHVWLHKGVHMLFYVVLLSLAASGMGIIALSGLTPFSVSPEAINRGAPPILGHWWLTRIYTALFAAHLLGVLRYQFADGDVIARMGLGWLRIGRRSKA